MKGIIVLKIGTKNLMANGRLDQDIFNDIARQVVVAENEGNKILIVSSGAIQAGKERMEDFGNGTDSFTKKALAGLGTRHLLNRWGEAFGLHGREICQFWVTYANWQDVAEISSIKTSILNCLNNGLIPIINENDVISDSEIRLMEEGISENDRLARLVAVFLNAKGVLFLTDAGGVFEDDPQTNPKARMYAELNPADFAIEKLHGDSGLGRGGIIVKIEEATKCFVEKMDVSIAGMEKNVLIKFSRGEPVGTKIGEVSIFK